LFEDPDEDHVFVDSARRSALDRGEFLPTIVDLAGSPIEDCGKEFIGLAEALAPSESVVQVLQRGPCDLETSSGLGDEVQEEAFLDVEGEEAVGPNDPNGVD
jgi:hypothetical protein